MATHRNTFLGPVAIAAAGILAALGAAPASALVTLHPGDSTAVQAGTTTPSLPPKLDFVFLMDTTGSMGGEISNAQNAASTMFDSIRADSPDSMFAVAGFDDYPYSTYGDPASPHFDRPYYLATDLTPTKAIYQAGLNSLSTHNGSGLDLPESQVPALYAAATGLGLSWPTGSTPASGISFRQGAAHVLVLVSDAPFHNDKDGNDPYAGFTAPTYAEALTALSEDHVRVLAADTGAIGTGATGVQPDMTAIAADTGGSRFSVNTNGTLLGTGILAALDALDYDVTTSISCDPLQVALDQDSFAGVGQETQVSHEATITAPDDVDPLELPQESQVACAVEYTWGDVAIGTFTEPVQVVLPSTTTLAGDRSRRKIKAAGAVAPDHAGEPVDVSLMQKQKSGGYETLQTKAATLSSSSVFSAKFARPKGGKCKLTASFAGDTGHDPSGATDKLAC